MAMKLISAAYPVHVRGDGVSASIAVDFYDQLHADTTIHNKNPDGVLVGASSATGTVSGTIVTLTWSPVLGNGVHDSPTIQFTFPG